ncbi:MAG: enoyl-CoA hydratase/isomerase family protein [Bacteroidota bacterium]|jgi:enoyl-CoA hydratase
MYSTILTEENNGLLKITINRPEKLNALNEVVLTELKTIIQSMINDSSIKGAIITGAGEKAFVAGADISGFLQVDKNQGAQLARNGQAIFSMIEQSGKPIMAAVNGFALGGGCELAMSCHFRYASEQAKFGQPEINLGIIPGYGGTQRLTRLIGKGRAMELMMRGDMIDAQQAYSIGLVNKVIPRETLIEEAEATMQLIISKPQPALSALIEATNAAEDDTKKGYETEARTFGEAFASDNMREGVTAFLEKRKPNFK